MNAGRRVAVNGRFLTQALTGVQRVALEVLRRVEPMTLFTPKPPRQEYSGLEHHDIVVAPSVFGSIAWDQMALPGLAAGATLLAPVGLFPIRHTRGVMFVHDLAVVDHPEFYDRMYGTAFRMALPLALRRAAHILTPSAFTRQRLLELYDVPESRTSVIPLGVSPDWFDPVDAGRLRSMGIDRPYLLAVGAVSARKNYRRLLDGWALVESRLPDVEIIIVGREGLKFANGDMALRAPARMRHVPHVDDESLRALYSGALAFVYPSLYEGFGLPVLEAMAAGTPVLTSNVTSMPEVSAGAAVLVDPHSAESIADGIWSLCTNAALRADLRAQGRLRAAASTWEATARGIMAILRELDEAPTR